MSLARRWMRDIEDGRFQPRRRRPTMRRRAGRGVAMRLVWGLAVATVAVSNLPADEPLRTFDGKHEIGRIHVRVVYFVPRDRTPLADWKERVEYFCRRIERFHRREFLGQSTLTTTIHPEPLCSSKSSAELRSGDRDFIFFQTMQEAESRVEDRAAEDGAFPILLVLSDINWRELDDFWRLRIVGDEPRFEGQIIGGRHFPGAESGGARASYLADRGVGWGLVSADGWRVPYTGSDCVVYHEGVGHAIGLPHPEPADGSVMSLSQYRDWLSRTWIDENQKKKLGWKPADDRGAEATDLYSAFTAIPEPPVPTPGQEVSLRFTWPRDAKVTELSVRLQTDLYGPWCEVPVRWDGPAPERVSIGRFDRPTPVSYRVRAAVEEGEECDGVEGLEVGEGDEAVELWGYFQVRTAPDAVPLPPRRATDPSPQPATRPARWDEAVDLLSLVDPESDAIVGQWTRSDARLESNKQYGARIEIPYQPPREYVLTVIAEPLDEPNALILGQRSGEHRFLVLVNFHRPGQPPASALENVDGLNVDRNATRTHATVLARNRPSALVCTVREAGVTVTCDGHPIIDWKGDASRLSLADYWQTPRQAALFLGAYDCRYRFHRVTLVPISGKGRRLDASP